MKQLIIKNLAVFLLGAIIGTAVSAPILYGTMSIAHKQSKKQQTLAHQAVLKEKNVLIAQCIEKDSHPTTNQFSPTIDKNKKGTIVVSPCPEIKQEVSVENSFSPVRSFKEGDTIANLTLLKTEHLTRRQKRRLSN